MRKQTSSDVATPPRKLRVFYGYWIVAFTFLCLLVSVGCGSFAFSLFVKSLQSSLDWSRGQIMVGFTIFWVMMGVGSPLVGRLLDRQGARRVIPLGAAVMGLGFVLLSVMSQLPLFYLGYVLAGIGAAGFGVVPCSAIVSNWFRRKRGTAIGIMAAGIGAGGVVIAPIAGYVIESLGWRSAYFALALIVWVAVVPLSLLIVRTKPADMGLYPDGVSVSPEEPGAKMPSREGGWAGLTLRQAIGTSAFWLISVSFFLSNFSSMGGLQAQVPYLNDIGFPTATAAAALGAVGFGSGVGKVVFGWLCDRIGPKRACVIGLCLQFSALLLLLQVSAGSPMALVWTYALLMGFGAGSWLPTVSMLVGETFGLAFYGSVFGAVGFALSAGNATGPLVAGLMYDSAGAYHWAFVLFAVLYAIALPAVLLVRRPRTRQ